MRTGRYGTGADEKRPRDDGGVQRVCTGSHWYDEQPLVANARKFGFAGSLKVHALLAQLVEHFHGKEGVDGSSPSEGLDVMPANHPVLAPPV
jgi:hypothetical protein